MADPEVPDPVTADVGIEIDTIPCLHDFVHVLGNNSPRRNLIAYGLQNAVTGMPRVQEWMTGVHLIRFSPELGNWDYMGFRAAVKRLFKLVAKCPIPGDIQRWLDLIAEGINGNEYLIRYNIALMEPCQAFAFIMTGRDLMERLRSDAQTAWVAAMIINWHANLYYWTNFRCSNRLLRETQEYLEQQELGQVIQLDQNLRGVLKLWRDTRIHSARRFEQSMMLIIEEDYPGETARFQRSIFRAGLLEQFNLEATMG